MEYPYIPLIFQGISAYSYIDLKEDSIKGKCCEMTPTHEQTSTDKHVSLHEVILSINYMIRQLVLVSKACYPLWTVVSPPLTPSHVYISKRSIKLTILPNLIHLHSLLTHVSFMLTKSPIQWMSSTWYWDSQSSRGKTKMYEKDKSNLQGVMSVITSHKPKLSSDK